MFVLPWLHANNRAAAMGTVEDVRDVAGAASLHLVIVTDLCEQSHDALGRYTRHPKTNMELMLTW